MGIAIEGDAQILLVDTPGIFAPNRRLDRAMVAAAWDRRRGCRPGGAGDRCRRQGSARGSSASSQCVEQRPKPMILVLNKVDIAKKDELARPRRASLAERLKPEAVFMISADHRRRRRRPESARLPPPCPKARGIFPEDQLSDATDRMVAAELTREQLYQPAPCRTALCDGGRDREVGGPQGRLDRHPPADPGRARQPEGDRPRQGRRRGSRPSARPPAKPNRRASRPQGPPVPARQGQPPLGRRPRALPGHRAGVGRLGAGLPRPTPAPARLAGPVRLSSKNMLPWLGSRLISSVRAPQ